MSSRSSAQSFADALHVLVDESHLPIDRYERAELLEWIAQVQAIRTILAPLIIANDLRGGDDWCEQVVRLLGDDRLVQEIEALLHRAAPCGAGKGSTETPHEPNDAEDLNGIASSLAMAWGRAGSTLR